MVQPKCYNVFHSTQILWVNVKLQQLSIPIYLTGIEIVRTFFISRSKFSKVVPFRTIVSMKFLLDKISQSINVNTLHLKSKIQNFTKLSFI